DAAAVSEDAEPIVVACDDEVLDVVLLTRLHADDTPSAAVLLAVRRKWHALGVVAAREPDDDVLVGDELLVGELPGQLVHDLGASVVAVRLHERVQIRLDEREDLARGPQDRLELGDELDRRLVLLVELLPLQRREAAQLHLEDGLRLRLREPPLLVHLADEQLLLAAVRADELDDRVEVGVRDLQALEDVRAVLRIAEIELGAPSDDLGAIVDVVLEDVLERQDLRLLPDEREHVEVESGLHRRVLEEVVEHAVERVVALHLDDDAHALAVALVADVADALEALPLHELGDLLDERRLVHGIRELAHDDRLAVAAELLLVRLRSHHDAPAAVRVRAPDPVESLGLAGLDVPLLLEAVDEPTAGKVGPEDGLAQVVVREVRVVDEALRRGDDLTQVVRRDVRRHADGDT